MSRKAAEELILENPSNRASLLFPAQPSASSSSISVFNMSVLRLVHLFENRVVPRDTPNMQVVHGRVDVQALIEMYDAWTSLAEDLPLAKVRPFQSSTRPSSTPAPTESTKQPTAAPTATAPELEAPKAPFTAVIKAPQQPQDQIFTSTLKPVRTGTRIPTTIRLPAATRISTATRSTTAKSPQLPTEQAVTSALPTGLRLPTAIRLPTAVRIPSATRISADKSPQLLTERAVTPTLPTAIRIPTATSTTTATLRPSQVVARQHPVARQQGPITAASRLFCYENDPMYLKRRAEAKQRRAAAMLKSSTPSWGL